MYLTEDLTESEKSGEAFLRNEGNQNVIQKYALWHKNYLSWRQLSSNKYKKLSTFFPICLKTGYKLTKVNPPLSTRNKKT